MRSTVLTEMEARQLYERILMHKTIRVLNHEIVRLQSRSVPEKITITIDRVIYHYDDKTTRLIKEMENWIEQYIEFHRSEVIRRRTEYVDNKVIRKGL